jgi:hypothetical protein
MLEIALVSVGGAGKRADSGRRGNRRIDQFFLRRAIG